MTRSRAGGAIAKLGGVPTMSQSDFWCIGWVLKNPRQQTFMTINYSYHLDPHHATRELMESQR